MAADNTSANELEISALIGALALPYYELPFAFESLANENLWKRPAAGLLSVGELAGHIAYWEAIRLAGEIGEHTDPGPTVCRVSSPLIDRRFQYYPVTLETTPTEEHLAMKTEQVCREVLRVHDESVAHFLLNKPDLESRAPGLPANFTYREYLQYLPFHVSYHTGQMYSVRHLLGEKPPDN